MKMLFCLATDKTFRDRLKIKFKVKEKTMAYPMATETVIYFSRSYVNYFTNKK